MSVFEHYLPKFTFTSFPILEKNARNIGTFYIILSLIFLWRNFWGVLLAYLIKEDVQNVILLFARKP